jgi:polyhydroxyalkanoate synthesis regulator protein
MERIFVKYGNRKIYDKTSKQYVKLEEIAQIVRTGHNIQVIDHKTKNDITYQVLVSVLNSQLLTYNNNNVGEIVSLINKGQ